jgi:hypothetical protein
MSVEVSLQVDWNPDLGFAGFRELLLAHFPEE